MAILSSVDFLFTHMHTCTYECTDLSSFWWENSEKYSKFRQILNIQKNIPSTFGKNTPENSEKVGGGDGGDDSYSVRKHTLTTRHMILYFT